MLKFRAHFARCKAKLMLLEELQKCNIAF